jgi:signal transduction histidine kinase/GAF domain-containing protein
MLRSIEFDCELIHMSDEVSTDDMIRPADALNLLPSMIHEGQSVDDLINACLQLLISVGFERARYYEIDDGDPDDGKICVLTHCTPGKSQPPRGYTIPWQDTALEYLGKGASVVLAPYAYEMPAPRWQRDLGLENKISVDIPVVAGGRTLGLLAADCNPARMSATLSDADRSVLKALGAMAGSAITRELIDGAYDPYTITQTAISTTPEQYALSALRQLMEEVDGAIGSVFRYDWRSQTLEKIYEQMKVGLGSGANGIFAEVYDVGSNLTGLAWIEPKVRYVPDFDRFRENRRALVSTGSFEYHSRLLKNPLKTVLYCVIGKSEQRYMLRIFNRADDPVLPFLNLRRRFLEIATYLSIGMDDLIARRRLNVLAETARSGVTNVTNPGKVVTSGIRGFTDENLGDFIFLCQYPGASRIAFSLCNGDYGHTSQKVADLRFPLDSTIDEIVPVSGTFISGRVLSAAFPGLGRIVASVDEPECEYILIRADAGQVSSMVIARLGVRTKRAKAGSGHLPPGARESVQTLASLFAEAVDSKYSHLTMTGARHALGYVGHELGTPLAMLGDTATAAIVGVMEEVDGIAGLAAEQRSAIRARLQRYYKRVQDGRGATDSALRLAPLVVQIGEGALPMYITRVELAETMQAAVNQVMSSTRSRQTRDSGSRVRDASRRFRIDINPSITRLGRVNCDQYLIRQLFVNMLDNAVKYSLPRYPKRRDEAMVITVHGYELNGDSISVSFQNWGLEVSRENRGAIFEPFVRGEQEDRLKAIRGMGLGLYLSRLIATAHRGSLDLRASERRKEDGRTDRGSEGYLTTFEVRLPRNLDLGTREYVWTDGRGHVEEKR